MNGSVRPNVLLIMVDQLAAQWLPVYGQSVVRAPALGALAAESVVFDAAYCASPLCAPSRAAMLCGRFASAVSVWDNAAELAASVPTFVHLLRAGGYRTCLAGKMHFVGPDQLHGFERRLTTDVYPSGFDWTPDWTRPVADRLPWYHSVASVLEPQRTVASLQTDYDDEVAFHAVREVHDMARSGDDRPFLLVVSFANPHDPWEVPGRYWDLYDAAAIDLPAVPMLSWDEADPHSRRLRQMSSLDEVRLSDADVRRARHGYYAAISYVDERIGSVLSALAECGFDEDTAIVFTADHGEFLGERGLWYKMSFLEPAARVPLFVRLPGGAARGRVSPPVSLVDLGPTLVELGGGLGAPFAWDGSSLVSVAVGSGGVGSGGVGSGGVGSGAVGSGGVGSGGVGSGAVGSGAVGSGAVGGRDYVRGPVICEYHAEGVNAPAAMVRDERYKLIVCRGDPDQLFDLSRDPLELVNLAESAEGASVVRRLRGELERRLDLADIERRVLASQRERRVVTAALSAGEAHAWDYQPYVDASMQYVRTREDLYELQRRGRLEAR